MILMKKIQSNSSLLNYKQMMEILIINKLNMEPLILKINRKKIIVIQKFQIKAIRFKIKILIINKEISKIKFEMNQLQENT